jgi:hypothetical protein
MFHKSNDTSVSEMRRGELAVAPCGVGQAGPQLSRFFSACNAASGVGEDWLCLNLQTSPFLFN